jgi:hypothetical protein
MSQCIAIIEVESSNIVAKYIPGQTLWPPGAQDPSPGEGQIVVPIPETMSWTCVNTVELVDGQWVFHENEELKAQFWNFLRLERNKRLSETDWTQVQDTPVDRQAWATYRRALRDLPSATTDPVYPNWPEKPV